MTQNRIKLDRTKLLGFRLDPAAANLGKAGAKFGTKIGSKLGSKPGVRPVS